MVQKNMGKWDNHGKKWKKWNQCAKLRMLSIDVLGKMGIGLEGMKELADWKQFVCEESLEESLNKLAFSFS